MNKTEKARAAKAAPTADKAAQIEVGKTYRDKDGHAYSVTQIKNGIVTAKRDGKAIPFPEAQFAKLVTGGIAVANAPKQAGSFSRAMDNAPRDGRHLQVLVATGDPSMPLSREIAWWTKDRTSGGEGWEGDWRYDDEPGNWADALPVAWAPILEIPADMWAEFAEKAKADLAAREKAAAETAAKATATKALPPHGKGNGKGKDKPGSANAMGAKLKPTVDVFDPL